jgi:hypothetical protein
MTDIPSHTTDTSPWPCLNCQRLNCRCLNLIDASTRPVRCLNTPGSMPQHARFDASTRPVSMPQHAPFRCLNTPRFDASIRPVSMPQYARFDASTRPVLRLSPTVPHSHHSLLPSDIAIVTGLYTHYVNLTKPYSVLKLSEQTRKWRERQPERTRAEYSKNGSETGSKVHLVTGGNGSKTGTLGHSTTGAPAQSGRASVLASRAKNGGS